MHSFTKPLSALLATLAIPLLAAGASAQHLSVQEVPLTTNHVLYDSFNGKIYASIPGSAALNPNTVARIDAATRAVEAYIPVGSEPDVLALSSDGSYLYVGIDGTSSVARLDLMSNTVDQQFSLGAGAIPNYPYRALNIVSLPGLPQSVAVITSFHNSVSVYDNGVQRTNITPYPIMVNVLTSSNSPNHLYGYDNADTGFSFYQFNVDANGVTAGQKSDSFGTGILQGFATTIKFDAVNGLVYASNGTVIDPVAFTDVGKYDSGYAADVIPSHSENRVYFLSGAGTPYSSPSGAAALLTYNQATYQQVSAATTAAQYGSVGDLFEISPTKFVFHSTQGVEFASPQTLTSLTVTAAAATIAAGKTDQFTATAGYPDGTTSDVTTLVTWNTDTPSAATITTSASSGAGLARGKASGTAQITATLNGVTSSPYALTVTPAHYQVLWDNADGRASVWDYNADSGTYTHREYGPFAGWTAKVIAQGGTDGKTHLLWNNTDGRASLWELDNTVGTFTHQEYGPYAGWSANSLSVTDSNTNALLWNNIDGSASLWNQTPDAFGSFTQFTFNLNPGWTAKVVADAPGDITQTLWGNTDGRMSLPGNFGIAAYNTFGPYAGWSANALSLAANNLAHILWANTDGRMSLWNYTLGGMDFAHKEYGPFTGWTATALADGSDGKTVVLWNNTNGSVSLWSLNNVTGVYSHAEFGPYPGWAAKAVSGN